MSRWRVATLAVLFLAPVVFLIGAGFYFLIFVRHAGIVAWALMTCSLALAYGLGWYWMRKRQLLPPPELPPSLLWTDRDRRAWEVVEAKARDGAKLTNEQFTDFQFYVDTAQQLALDLARAYSPAASDPISKLTIPEILAVVELSSHDMAELVDQYLPGGHLLTIQNWRQTRQAAEWYQVASNLYWLTAAIFSPIETGLRYAASQAGVSTPWQKLQENLLVWFYTAYVHRVGAYLIELYSGRLRVGVKRYRELVQGQKAAEEKPIEAEPEPAPARQVTITVMGQVKAGKSSLINALLGEQRAHTDVLPATNSISRYQLQPRGLETQFALLDTVGYGHTGPKEDQLKATQQAAQQSDLLLLVLHARNPARQADLELLQGLTRWFADRPHLKLPPILGVLTHIDLLSPAMEWAPPYNWQEPTKPKEKQIQAALTTVRDQLQQYLAGCVPVCDAPGKIYGIEEWLLPTMVELLDEAHAVGLIRCLRAEADTGKVRKIFRQLLAIGKEVSRVLWQEAHKPPAPTQPTHP